VAPNKAESLVTEAGLANAPTLAHQIGWLIDGATIAAMATRNPEFADHAGPVLRVRIDRGKPAARKIAPPKLRACNSVHT
jgi:hypothetical protein